MLLIVMIFAFRSRSSPAKAVNKEDRPPSKKRSKSAAALDECQVKITDFVTRTALSQKTNKTSSLSRDKDNRGSRSSKHTDNSKHTSHYSVQNDSSPESHLGQVATHSKTGRPLIKSTK